MESYVEPNVNQRYAGVTLASGVLTTVVGPFHLARLRNQAGFFLNQSLSTISGAVLQVNPDTTSDPNAVSGAMWITVASATSIASGTLVQLTATTPAKWGRIAAISNFDSLTVSGYWYGVSI